MSGIYIHIPFCKQACHYCNFHFSTSLKHKQVLINAIKSELKLRKEELNKPIQTLYFGGGTPSILDVEELNEIIHTVYDNYKVIDNPEITLEANPDDLSEKYIKELSQKYFNRLSIGIQSFCDQDLKLMNRAHNAREAHIALHMALDYFENISIDLIYGIQDQTDEMWLKNLEKAINYKVPHISSYALTVEPKTALASFIEKEVVKDVDDDQAQRQFNMMIKVLENEDYVHYEISNFGKEGYFSRNNSAYWQQKHYLGIGPSAHSFNGKQRFWNISNNMKYMRSISEGKLPISIENLSQKDQYNEYIMTGLRTIWGVSTDEIQHRFGNKFVSYFKKGVSKYVQEHLIYEDENVYNVTRNGRFLADGIAAGLFMI